MPLIFAVLVALSAIGIVFSYAVQLLERLCMPWQRKRLMPHFVRQTDKNLERRR